MIFATTFVVADSETDAFIYGVNENPTDYKIVVSSTLSNEEYNLAAELGAASGALIIDSSEVYDEENLIIVGDSGKNPKVAELGNSSLGSYYVYENNLFISGGSQENIEILQTLVDDFNSGRTETYVVVNESESEEEEIIVPEESYTPLSSPTKEVIEGKEITKSSDEKGFLFYFFIFLVVGSVAIIGFLIYSLIIRPMISNRNKPSPRVQMIRRQFPGEMRR